MIRALVSILFAAGTLASTGCGALRDDPASYDGAWQGTWTASGDTAGGALSMSLHDDGAAEIDGSVDIGGTFCVGSANVVATVGGGGLSGTFTNGVNAVDIDGAIDGADDFSGTFDVTSGLCGGSSGTFTMHR